MCIETIILTFDYVILDWFMDWFVKVNIGEIFKTQYFFDTFSKSCCTIINYACSINIATFCETGTKTLRL